MKAVVFFLLILASILQAVSAQRFNPDFNMMGPDGQYYKQIYDQAIRDLDQGYNQQKEYLKQNQDYMKEREDFKKWLMNEYKNENVRTDEYGNLMAGEKDAPLFLTCNGQGCVARG